MERTPAFTDTDKMPFGKHSGLPLQDVPSSYLSWLRDALEKEGVKELKVGAGYNDVYNLNKIKLYNYIMNSWDAIKQDLPDRV